MYVKPQFTFQGILESVKLNLLTTAVYLPHHIILELPKGRIRISGTINGAPFSLAVQYRKDGSRYFTVGATLRKAARIQAGDSVDVTFKVLNLLRVEAPETFEVVPHQDREVRNIGRIFSKPAKQNLDDYIKTIKNMDVRLRRSIENIQRSRIAGLQPLPNNRKRSGR